MPDRNFKHSQGPWFLVEERQDYGDGVVMRDVCRHAEGRNAAGPKLCLNSVIRDGEELYPERPYNARLVQKAPELADNLAWLVERLQVMVRDARRDAKKYGDGSPMRFLAEWLYLDERGKPYDEKDVLAVSQRLLDELESEIGHGETVEEARRRHEEVEV